MTTSTTAKTSTPTNSNTRRESLRAAASTGAEATRANASALRLESAQAATTSVLRSINPSTSNWAPSSGNSTQVGPSTSPDRAELSTQASTISSNQDLQKIFSEILGRQSLSGNSAQNSLLSNFVANFENSNSQSSNSQASEDPAARFRSETKVPLEGYDQGKLDNPNHKTPKYIFGRVAQDFKLDSVQGDKAKAEELLKAMVPELREKGLEVVSVEGDRIQVKTEHGYEWVDVVRGAGTDKPGWWWGSEGKGTPNPTASSKEWAQATGQSASAGVASPSPSSGGTAPAAGGGAAPAAGGAAASAPKATPLGNQIDSARVMAILKKQQPTNEGMLAAEGELQQAFPGVKILDHPVRLDKLQFTNGAVVDVVVGAGGPNPSWGWMPEN